jgi:4-hydroxybenzoate polyprenyltransferase
MKKLETILLGLFFLSIILKIFSLSGGELILLLSGASLAMFYYVAGYFIMNDVSLRRLLKERNGKNVSVPVLFGSIMAGWDFSIITLGILFKLMFFPGADNMLVTGIILLTVLQIGSIFIRKTHPETFARFFNRVIIFFGAGLLASFISYNQIIDFQYSDDQEYSEALKKTMAFPNDTSARLEFDAIRIERSKE